MATEPWARGGAATIVKGILVSVDGHTARAAEHNVAVKVLQWGNSAAAKNEELSMMDEKSSMNNFKVSSSPYVTLEF